MGQIIFNNGVTFAAGEDTLLKPELQFLFDETITSAEYPEGVMEAMGYVTTNVINPKGTFSSVFGTPELDELVEGQNLPELPVGKWPEKSYKIKEFGDKIAVTQQMYDWLLSAGTLEGADSSVKSEFQTFAQNFRTLRKAAIKSKNFEATRVLTEGWVGTNPNWPGSPTPQGQALFGNNHPVDEGLAGVLSTFQNVLWGSYGTADAALTDTTLQLMLDIAKSELKTYVGDRISIPEAYVLITGRRLSTEAQKILQTPGVQPGKYSGRGNNAMELNEFSFNGNKVAHLNHPVIGAGSKQGQIGSDTMYFLANTEAIGEAKALRHFILNNGVFDMWEDKNSKTRFVSFYESCAFDHYGLEAYMVWSRGTA